MGKVFGRFIGAVIAALLIGYLAHLLGAFHPDLAALLAAIVGAGYGWLAVTYDQHDATLRDQESGR